MERLINTHFAEYLQETLVNIPEQILELAETTKDQDVMDKLSNDQDWRVRSRIAKKINLRLKTLTKLSNDNDYLVRLSIVGNEATPSNVLEEMLKDKEPLVRAATKIALKDRQGRVFRLWE